MRRLLTCLLMGIVSIAEAQESGYVGLSFGSLDYEENFVDPLLGQVSDSIDHYKIFGGFEINQYLAIEVNYSKAGDVEASATINDLQCGPIPCGEVTEHLDMDVTITSVSAMGMLPKEWGALIAGLGYFSSETDFRNNFTVECCGPIAESGTISDDGIAATVGIEWRFGRFGARYGLRLAYDWWDMDGVSSSSVGLGAFYGF